MTCEAHKDMVCCPCCMFAYYKAEVRVFPAIRSWHFCASCKQRAVPLFCRLKQATG